MERKLNLKYCPDNEILVTVGGSEAIDACMRAVIEPGDEVIIPTPSFVCYEPLAKMAGATPVILETYFENEFKIDPEKLKSLINDKTKMIVLPFPNNPTGAIMTRDELEEIAEIAKTKKMVAKSRGGIVVKGVHDVSVRFSKCCNPVPGDEIIGYITKGRGVSVHRTDCVNIKELFEEENRIIDVEWYNEEKTNYNVEIAIFANDRNGLLADIINTINVNIIKLSLNM